MAKRKFVKPEPIKTAYYYVEVLYFKAKHFIERKFVNYSEEEAKKVFLATVKKFTENKGEVIICIRDANHILQVSERLNF